MKVVLITRAVLDYSVEYANAISYFCDVTLCVPRSDFGNQIGYLNKSIDLCLFEWPRNRSLRNISLIYKLVTTIKERKPDLVHFLSSGAVWLNIIVPFIRSIPIVTTVHDITCHPGDWSSKRIPQVFRDFFIRHSKAIFIHGEKLKEQAKEYYKLDDSCIHLIYHVARFRYKEMALESRMAKKEDGKFRILFFGRIFEYKGLQYLIQTESLVKDSISNVQFVIAGVGEDFTKYSSLISDPAHFDIRNRHIPDMEVAQLFTDADIVVLPYIEASQSGVIPISMTFGKPVIATDVGSLSETMGEANMGLVIPPKDSKTLARAIIKLARDSTLRNQLGTSALTFANSNRSHRAIGYKAFQIYQEILR